MKQKNRPAREGVPLLQLGEDVKGCTLPELSSPPAQVLVTGAKGGVQFHTRAAEMFHVLSGTMRILVDDRVVTLGTGDFLTVPPHVPHAFAPAPGCAAEMLVVLTPGLHRFDYYRLLERVHRGEATVEDIRESSERYDNHYVESPVWRKALAEG